MSFRSLRGTRSAQWRGQPRSAQFRSCVDGASRVAAAEVEKKRRRREIDKELSSHDLFLNRELTWLAFNRRVLHEAEDERNPLSSGSNFSPSPHQPRRVLHEAHRRLEAASGSGMQELPSMDALRSNR